jgi:hypothetical protein
MDFLYIKVIKRMWTWTGLIAHVWNMKKFLFGRRKSLLWVTYIYILLYNIKMDVSEVGCQGVNWINLVSNRLK